MIRAAVLVNVGFEDGGSEGYIDINTDAAVYLTSVLHLVSSLQ